MHTRVHHALPTVGAELQDRPAVHVLEGCAPAAGSRVPPVGAGHRVPPTLKCGHQELRGEPHRFRAVAVHIHPTTRRRAAEYSDVLAIVPKARHILYGPTFLLPPGAVRVLAAWWYGYGGEIPPDVARDHLGRRCWCVDDVPSFPDVGVRSARPAGLSHCLRSLSRLLGACGSPEPFSPPPVLVAFCFSK